MARWFWYLSSQKISGLKAPPTGWGFLADKVGKLEVEAGVPWAKLKSKDAPESSLVRDLEKVEQDIRQTYEVCPLDQLGPNDSPLFFQFTGQAGRLVLRESYKDEKEGDTVFLLAGIEGKTGIILLGAGSNVFGSSAARPRWVDPSVDPVGALLVHLDRHANKTEGEWPRAGITRDASGLRLEEVVLYSFASALQECQEQTFLSQVHSLAVFTSQVAVHGRQDINGVKLPDVERVIIGSPVYVEQLGSDRKNSDKPWWKFW